MKKFKWFLVFFGLFLYFNTGVLVVEGVMYNQITQKTNWVQPIKVTETFLDHSIIEKDSNKIAQEIKKLKYKNKRYFFFTLLFWPIYFIFTILWQWLWVGFEFIFLGGLIKYSIGFLGYKLYILLILLLSSILLLFSIALKTKNGKKEE